MQNRFVLSTDGCRLVTTSWSIEFKFKLVLASWRSNLDNWMRFGMEKGEISYLGGNRQLYQLETGN